jgi:hypothetical protein
MMKRRVLGGAAGMPLAARAQQPTMPVVGFLSTYSSSDAFEQHFLAAFHQGLIPDCGDTDSSAAPSALEHGAYIPLDHHTFLQ